MEKSDIYLQKLFHLLNQNDYKLFSKRSMSTYGLFLLSNEIKKFNFKHIIEFGSGISSIVMARSIQKCNLEGKIIAIESDPYYCDDLNDFVWSNGLHKVVKFIYAPLYPCPYLQKNKWYDPRALYQHIDDDDKFDMVVIDGPPAWNDKIKLSRYGALPFVMNYLAEGYSIFLDDANREGEKEIMKIWKEKYEITFTVINNRIAVCRKSNNEYSK